jgi:hypothetical protein
LNNVESQILPGNLQLKGTWIARLPEAGLTRLAADE